MKTMTVEIYLTNLLLVCDEMLETLQKARLNSNEIDRWKLIVDSYKQPHSTTVIHSDLDKYI